MFLELFFLFFLALSMVWPARPVPSFVPLSQVKNWGRSYLIRLINLTNYEGASAAYVHLDLTQFDLFGGIAQKAVRHQFFGSYRILLSVLTIDLMGYLFHFAMHRISILKRVHAVHHIERDVTVFTALRAHPIEVFIFVACDFLIVCFYTCTQFETEMSLMITGLFLIFTHANWRMPPILEKTFGAFFVTSGHHQWHHVEKLQNGKECNFATVFTFWDRLFGTYRPPTDDYNHVYGLSGLSVEKTKLFDLLFLRMKKSTAVK